MQRLFALCLVVAVLGCGPRRVVVENAPAPAAEVSLSVTNQLAQAINVYVVTGGADQFLRQVSAGASEVIPVPNVPSGTTVQLKARTADGTRTYTRDGVVMRGTVSWQVR